MVFIFSSSRFSTMSIKVDFLSGSSNSLYSEIALSVLPLKSYCTYFSINSPFSVRYPETFSLSRGDEFAETDSNCSQYD